MSAGTGTRWVTFDCYGTLIDWQAGFTGMLSPFAGERAADVVKAYDASEREVEREQPHRSYKDVIVQAVVRAAADRGVRLSDADARTLPRSWGSMRLFDDVEALLAELRARGFRLAVLTNCDDDLFEMTHRAFRVPFDLFVTAERVRGYKPEPWLFRGFERMTGVERGDWVHVGSDWYHDIAPAQALGVSRVWLDREGLAPTGAALRAASGEDVVRAIDQHFACN